MGELNIIYKKLWIVIGWLLFFKMFKVIVGIFFFMCVLFMFFIKLFSEYKWKLKKKGSRV